jgi:glycosyltransferase involved in cell wall biosynthesis
MTDAARPIISVAIATCIYGRYLPRALDSVFRSHNPTHAPLQVVVADDVSTDNTRSILADYRQRYPQSLQIISLRTRAGAGAAKNAALDCCQGRTVAILDADDEFLPGLEDLEWAERRWPLAAPWTASWQFSPPPAAMRWVRRAEAEWKGKKRAIGERVRVVVPGEW